MRTAIILAAGRGQKMWPYGATRNKAVLPVANRPLLHWTLDALRDAGFDAICVVADYRQEQLAHALANQAGVQLIMQKSGSSGTVAALLSAWSQIEDREVLVCYGDVLFAPEDLKRLLERHRESDAPVTALVQRLGPEQPNQWLCCQTQGEIIQHILAHARDQVSHRLCGVYALKPAFLPYLKRNPGRMAAIQVAMMAPDEAHIEDSMQLAIDEHLQLAAVDAQTFFMDLDKPWHLLQANYLWLNYLGLQLEKDQIGLHCKISDGATINGRIVAGEHCEIGPGVIVEGNLWLGDHSRLIQGAIVEADVAIGRHCLVRRYCQVEANTSIADRCVVGHGAEVSGILMYQSYAYHYGEFWGILGESGDLGAATVCGNLRFDDAQTSHRTDSHRETPVFGANAAYLGDYVRTGVNAIIMPGVKIGPYSVIGAGTIIQEDVPDRSLVYVKQELIRKSWGPERYGW